MKKILITGFEPFGEDTINPSLEAVKRLPDEICGVTIIKKALVTVQYQSLNQLEEYILLERPDVVLSVGQAAGREGISVERIGINVDDYRIKDNRGNQPIDQAIVKDGPVAYFSTLPIKAMVKAIRDQGIAASVSNTAGTFVCNHVLYGTRHLIETKYPGIKSGFIHVPLLPEQVKDGPAKATLQLADIVSGLSLALRAVIEHENGDILEAGGRLD